MDSDARRRAEEYLANRIFSLQWKKCEAHTHTLCSVCAADWIVKDKADAVAQAVKERDDIVQRLQDWRRQDLTKIETLLAGVAQQAARLRAALEAIAMRTDGPSFHLGGDIRGIINEALRAGEGK